MPSIFDPSARAAIEARIARLTPNAQPVWGKMNAAKMQRHITAQLLIALGQLRITPQNKWLPRTRFFHWLVIDSPMPWPKGVPTAPELLSLEPGEWEADRAKLLAAIDEVVRLGESHDWHPHSAFGKLTGRQWGILMWRHIDHHLRQFGVS